MTVVPVSRWIRIRARQKKASMKGSIVGRPPDDDIITTEQAREVPIRCKRQIQHQQRWVNHYQNRLIYGRAMLDENGGVVTGHGF